LASGTAFLLPYYMGLYLGIIEAPSKSETTTRGNEVDEHQ